MTAPFIHLCEFDGCKAWGSFGYRAPGGQYHWFCRSHRADGEALLAGAQPETISGALL